MVLEEVLICFGDEVGGFEGCICYVKEVIKGGSEENEQSGTFDELSET